MLDLKFILKNREFVEKNCQNRNVAVNLNLIEDLAQKRSVLIQKIEADCLISNKIAKGLKLLQENEKVKSIENGKIIREKIKSNEILLKEIEAKLNEELYKVPNLSHPDSPIGKSDKDNIEVARIGEIKEFSFLPKDHVELGKNLDIIDFESGSIVSGNKFYFLKNEGVFLEFALIQYVLQILNKYGFTPFITPDIAKMSVIEGIGFIPRGEECQIYKIEGSDLGLIATAEITLGGMYKNTVIDAEKLPLKLCGVSHCFRTEAGAYGKASKGLYRVHQFSKVEMFVFSHPKDSDKMLESLVKIEKEIFQGLEIPFRIVRSCTAELGGPAYCKFDLEAWLPSEKRWGEITSASNCTDYQARRLNIKFKRKEQKGVEFVHTLNGTAIAISRALLTILDNLQEEDGSVRIPKVLQPFMNQGKISPKK